MNEVAKLDAKSEYRRVLEARKQLLRERVAKVVEVLRALPEATIEWRQIGYAGRAKLRVGPNVGFIFPHGFEAYDTERHTDLMYETLQMIMLDGDLLVIHDIATTEARIVATGYIQQYFENIYEHTQTRRAQAVLPSHSTPLLEGVGEDV